MSSLDPAHVEAVARAMGIYYPGDFGPNRVRSEDVLTSTDPAVHAALLAALVPAGVLRVEEWPEDEAPTHRRYVTRWEDA